jgi:uncharacterized protein (DUF58 family)
MIPKEVIKKVKQIEIKTRGLVNDVFSGEYHSAFKGLGMEFADVREYQHGDDIRKIDWNVSARARKTFIKTFDEERELTVMLMVDVSQSSQFGSAERMKGEIAVELAAIFAFSAIKNNDKVGLILFTDTVELFIPPRKGRQHVLRVIRELLYFEPKGKGTNVGAAIEYLNRVVKRKATCFLISDFISSDYKKPLQVANKRHDLVAITIIDPRENSLPNIGLIEFEDAETGEVILIDTGDRSFQSEFTQTNTAEREERAYLFRQTGVDLITIQTNESYVEPIRKFFKKRESKMH